MPFWFDWYYFQLFQSSEEAIKIQPEISEEDNQRNNVEKETTIHQEPNFDPKGLKHLSSN